MMTAERRAELLKEMEEEDKEIQDIIDSGYLDDAFARLEAKRKPISIKLQRDVVEGIKAIAKDNNIPYQTLIGVILKRYVNGDITINKPLV